MIEISEQLAAVDARDPAATGTKRTHYSGSSEGPFRCSDCVWFDFRAPEGGEDPTHLRAVPHGRCDHPEILLDDEVPWADAEETAKVVENGGCCEYKRPLPVPPGVADLSELLSRAEPRNTSWRGVPIAIENPIGSVREGKGWRTVMKRPYGYVRRVTGLDQEWLDCFVGPEKDADQVFIVRALRPETGVDDEDKVILGAGSEQQAREIFLEHYDDERFLGPIRSMSLDGFKEWIGMQGADVQLADVVGRPIAVDFDGTLAERRQGDGWEEGGPPIDKTFELVRELRARGLDPYVLTARTDLDQVRDYLKRWDLTIEVTNVKKPGTLAVVDDRAVDAEKHGLKGMLRRVLEKIALAERGIARPLRDAPTPFWDEPVHAQETHVNFRAIHSLIQRRERELAGLLAGGLRVKITRALAKQAAKQLKNGAKPHQLAMDAPAEVEEEARPHVAETYRAARDDAAEESTRLLGRKRRVALDQREDQQKADEASALAALLYLLAERYNNFLAGAIREAVLSDPQILALVKTGDLPAARARIEAFANEYSAGRLDVLADQTTREAVRSGRGDEFAADPRLAGVVWRRSSVLEPSTCTPCRLADMTEIPGPEYDVTEICDGALNCRCLPVAVLKDEVAP